MFRRSRLDSRGVAFGAPARLDLRGVAFGAPAMWALFALVACSTDAPSSMPAVERGTVHPQTQGPLSPGNPFAVGVCLKASGPGACGATCSGTLVAPNLVLTARHCVDALTNTQGLLRCGIDKFTTRSSSAAQTFITTAADLNQASQGWHAVSEIRTPADDDGCRSDIALLVLTDSVPAAEANPADVLAFGSMTDHTRYSTEVTLIGFGRSDPSLVGSVGKRRILEHALIQCIPGDPVFIDPFCKGGGSVTTDDGSVEDTLDDPSNFRVSYGGCPGDSGGGAYEQRAFEEGKPIVMGVQSRGATEGSVCLGLGFTRTDYWKDFLVAGATAAAQRGNYPLPGWAQGITIAPRDVDASASTASTDAASAPSQSAAACQRSSDCESGACVAVADAGPRCVERCLADRRCGAESSVCTTVESIDVCVPAVTTTTSAIEPGEPGGCSIAEPMSKRPTRGPGGWGSFLLLAVAGLMLAGRARRR